MIAKHMHRLQDEIVEVERVEGLEARWYSHTRAPRREQHVASLPAAACSGLSSAFFHAEICHCTDSGVTPLLPRQAFADEIETVLGIVDRKARFVTAGCEFLAQDGEAEGMEGGDGKALASVPLSSSATRVFISRPPCW